MFFSIVGEGICILLDIDDNLLDRVDNQLVINNHEGNICEVRIDINEVFWLQLHRVFTYLSTCYN